MPRIPQLLHLHIESGEDFPHLLLEQRRNVLQRLFAFHDQRRVNNCHYAHLPPAEYFCEEKKKATHVRAAPWPRPVGPWVRPQLPLSPCESAPRIVLAICLFTSRFSILRYRFYKLISIPSNGYLFTPISSLQLKYMFIMISMFCARAWAYSRLSI